MPSTSKVSILAVPSKCKSWNSKVEEPKSLDPSASGNMSPPTVTPAPTRRAPLIVPTPATARLPFAYAVTPVPTDNDVVTKAVSSTSNVSIWAVPSMNKSLNSNEDAPKSLAPSVEGTKSLSNLPVAVIVSEVALPRFSSPFAFNVPFVFVDEIMEDRDFLIFCEQRGLMTLKGHRSVGGFRASIYNSMPESGVDALISAMQEYEISILK